MHTKFCNFCYLCSSSLLFKPMLANQKEVASWFSMVSQNVITLIVINDPNNSYHGYINQQSTRMKVISLSNLTLFNLNQICYSEFNYTLFYQKLGIRSIKVITFVITHCALKSLCHHRLGYAPIENVSLLICAYFTYI